MARGNPWTPRHHVTYEDVRRVYWRFPSVTPRTHYLPLSQSRENTLQECVNCILFFLSLFPFFFSLFFTKTPADHRAVQEVPPLGDSPTLSQFPFNTDLLALLRQYTSCHSTTTFWGYRFLACNSVAISLYDIPDFKGSLQRAGTGFSRYHRARSFFLSFLRVGIIIMFSRE